MSVSSRGSRSTGVVAAPAARMPARQSSHWGNAAALSIAGVAGIGAAPLVGYAGWGMPVLVGGLTSGAAVAVSGSLARRRGMMADRLLEALSPTLGVRQLDRRIVRLSRWTRGWPGLPRVIQVRYASAITKDEAEWKEEILRIVAGRLLARYRVGRQDRRSCVLWLSLEEDLGKVTSKPRAQVRAERAIAELIGPTAKVTGVDLDGESLRSFTVAHQAGAKLAASGYRSRVERVISTMMPGRWRAVWDLEADTVRFEVRPTLATSVWLPAKPHDDAEDLLANYRQVAIPCAVDEDGREVLWYPARTPHAMLTGGTGTGKTSTAHALLGQITQYGWPVWVLDAKRVEFLDFRDWPNVQIVAGSIPQQVALIRRVWELMEFRYQLIEDGRATVNDFEPLVVFLDEFAEFRSNLFEWYAQVKTKGDPSKPPTIAEAASLARKARTARIHLVLSTQRPDAEFLGGEMRDNYGFRISMGRLSPQGAMMMWENAAVGVTLPRSCTGRATATHEDGRPVEVQCYRFPDLYAAEGSEEWNLLRALRPAQSRHPRLVIVPPEDQQVGEEVTAPTFRDYARAKWDKAENRPDLDPLASQGSTDGLSGRELSSTLASLGLGDGPSPSTRRWNVFDPASVDEISETYQAPDGVDADEYGGYLPPASCSPRDLMVGDLIEVDEGSGVWVVVDEAPEDDIADPGMIAVSWRGDGDESGSVSLSDDVLVDVRRPEEML
jgi:DNA segregation ATPase FtsK/SpoIIIE, S-DNA-T family